MPFKHQDFHFKVARQQQPSLQAIRSDVVLTYLQVYHR
jgi:hypothetical protein